MLRAERLVRNQILRRAFNESIADAASTFDDVREPGMYEFICECKNRSCSTMVMLRTSEYDEVRAHPNAFVVTHGHEQETIERVVVRHPRYLVVAKFHPEPMRLAIETDPRG
jgi:hypothetical protein